MAFGQGLMERLQQALRGNRAVDLALFGLLVIAALGIVALLPEPAIQGPEGNARVIDGDSLYVGGSEVRLKGIDAPEARQNCFKSSIAWDCGREAGRRLKKLIGGVTVRCEDHGRDTHDRVLGECWVGDVEINHWLVEQGWAVSFGGYGMAEWEARTARRGLWAGEFDRPKDWRAQNMAN